MIEFQVSLGFVEVSLGLVTVNNYFGVSIKSEFAKVIYLGTSAINYQCYGKRRPPHSPCRLCEFV